MTDWKQDKDDPHLWTYEWNPYREMSTGPLPRSKVANDIRNEAFEEAAKVASNMEDKDNYDIVAAIRALKVPT